MRWRGPAVTPDTDEAGVAAEFQGQSSEVSRYSSRKRVRPMDVGDAEWYPASGDTDGVDARLSLLTGGDAGGESPQQLGRGGGLGDFCSGLSGAPC